MLRRLCSLPSILQAAVTGTKDVWKSFADFWRNTRRKTPAGKGGKQRNYKIKDSEFMGWNAILIGHRWAADGPMFPPPGPGHSFSCHHSPAPITCCKKDLIRVCPEYFAQAVVYIPKQPFWKAGLTKAPTCFQGLSREQCFRYWILWKTS